MIQRYDPMPTDPDQPPWMERSITGLWVSHSDIAPLLAEVEELRKYRATVEAGIRWGLGEMRVSRLCKTIHIVMEPEEAGDNEAPLKGRGPDLAAAIENARKGNP